MINYREKFFEADCLVDTLLGHIDEALTALQSDLRMAGRNKAKAILLDAMEHIREYDDWD